MKDVIVEMRGGVLVEIYCDDSNARFVVVDWDQAEDGELSKPGAEWEASKLASLPEDTKVAYRKATNRVRADDCLVTQVKNA